MDNFLNNGTVLPSGLLGCGYEQEMAGFNKTYRNTSLRLGIVVRIYPIIDFKNISKLTTEYDVLVFEQNEDKGSSIITYKNCLSAEGFGSIADYFEKTLRAKEGSASANALIDTKNQNGSVVLIQCLDGMSDKAIVIGAMTHPDRKTTLVDDKPYLEGEYNGANIKVATDGSVTFTFKGATDNDGKLVDESQGPTIAKIEKDGSFELNHAEVTFRLDKNGTATLTTSKDVVVNASGKVDVTAEGNVNVKCNALNAEASGKAIVKASTIELNGQVGQVLTNITDPVVDTIFGTPTVGVPTVKAG